MTGSGLKANNDQTQLKSLANQVKEFAFNVEIKNVPAVQANLAKQEKDF